MTAGEQPKAGYLAGVVVACWYVGLALPAQ